MPGAWWKGISKEAITTDFHQTLHFTQASLRFGFRGAFWEE